MMLTPEAYGCISLAFRHLEARLNTSKRYSWRYNKGNHRVQVIEHTEKAQKLFSEANRHLRTRHQPTLGDFDENKILAIMGHMDRLGSKSRVYEEFLRKIS